MRNHLSLSSPRFLTCSGCLLAVALGLSGCGSSHARYPDPTQETRIHTDEIHADAARSQEKIATDLIQDERALDFRVEQTKNAATRERGQLLLERDNEIQPIAAEDRETTAAAERNQTRVDVERDAKLKSIDGAEAERVRAEATSQKAEIERSRTTDANKREVKRQKAEAQCREKIIAIDEREAKDLAAITHEREEVIRKARANRLQVEADTTEKLGTVGKDSKKRMDASSDVEADRLKDDRSIDKKVRGILDRDGDKAKNISFSTNNGVVTLTGKVSDERFRRDLVSRISHITGVTSVDNRLVSP